MAPTGLALAEALALSNDQAPRPILAGERRPVRDRAAASLVDAVLDLPEVRESPST